MKRGKEHLIEKGQEGTEKSIRLKAKKGMQGKKRTAEKNTVDRFIVNLTI